MKLYCSDDIVHWMILFFKLYFLMTLDMFSVSGAGAKERARDGNDSEMSEVSFSQPPNQQHN